LSFDRAIAQVEAFIAQQALRPTGPVHYRDEVIRDSMLADATIAERQRATGVARATVAKQARRFIEAGRYGLGDRRARLAS